MVRLLGILHLLFASYARTQSESSARVVNTLLTELDGLDGRKNVYVVAATNRPDMIDPAMCRPGRLDKLLYVDLPSPDERVEIVRTMVRKVPLDRSMPVEMEVEQMVRARCDGYSGADLASVVREAGVMALKRCLGTLVEGEGVETDSPTATVVVGTQDFVKALDKVGPSVSAAQRRKYLGLKNKFAGLPMSGRPIVNNENE
jgi:ribosome biogenesis ATPase